MFLTHTVQMKRVEKGVENGRIFIVLNPHGSDETELELKKLKIDLSIFLTHTVQMKLDMSEVYLRHVIAFLTHTVQMKLFNISQFLYLFLRS